MPKVEHYPAPMSDGSDFEAWESDDGNQAKETTTNESNTAKLPKKSKSEARKKLNVRLRPFRIKPVQMTDPCDRTK